MSLAEVSIRRPVLALVLSIAIVVFGLVGFEFLGVREYPAVDPPVVTVTTNYGGASPEVVAAQITEPLEQSISGVAGVRVMSSTSRDGQSQYYLNGGRCRRRDITDIFLGTGLGARSYSIIEQGMISQVVESDPESLRHHLEEAAGISKYKERRKETESRIKSTRENLDRVRDVRDEVDKQLEHLNRQAKAAARWQTGASVKRRQRSEVRAMDARSA